MQGHRGEPVSWSGKRITVIQLARFGDLIQSSPLLQNLVSAGATVTLLVDRRTIQAAHLLHGVDRVIGVDLASFPVQTTTQSLSAGYARAKGWAEEWRDAAAADRVLLLNQGDLPSLIASLVPAVEYVGPFSGRPIPPPHRYLNAALSDRTFNPVHLCEIWAAYGPPILPLKRPRFCDSLGTPFAKPVCSSVERPEMGRSFAVNTGAGAAGRRPNAEKLAVLVESLLDLGATKVDLLGGPDDIDNAGYVLNLLRSRDARVRNLAGRTHLHQLPGLLAQHHVLISPDTGTLQLAAATGCRPLGLFYGQANPAETGPYCQNAVALVHKDSLAQDEDSRDDYLADLDMSVVAKLAWHMCDDEYPLQEFEHAFHPFHLLVAGSSPLGVSYRSPSNAAHSPFAKGERWLPLLKHLLFGQEAQGGTPGECLVAGSHSDELAAAGITDWVSGKFERTEEVSKDEANWIEGVLRSFELIDAVGNLTGKQDHLRSAQHAEAIR